MKSCSTYSVHTKNCFNSKTIATHIATTLSGKKGVNHVLIFDDFFNEVSFSSRS